MKLSDRQYLTPAEVASALRVSTATVARWAANGSLRSVRAGKSCRFEAADVEAFIHSSTDVSRAAVNAAVKGTR